MQAPSKWIRPALASKASVGEAFAASMRAALEQIAANASGAAMGRDPEYLHQMRVGVRRLRSALRAFRKLLRRRRADAIARPWRAMMPTLGDARDWDVFYQSLAAGGLRRAASKPRAAAQQLACALMKSPRFHAALRNTSVWTRSRPWRRHADPSEPLRQFARPALHRLHQGLCDAAEGIDWQDAARRHRLRIRVKRMRYACDFLAAVFPHRRARAFLEALHGLQDILGEMSDIDVQRRLLGKLARSSENPAAVMATEAKLKTHARALAALLRRAWAAFEAVRPYWKRREAARG